MTESVAAMRSLVVERVMPHPPEKIWRALTQAPLIEEWLMQNDFQPIVGHRFNFRAAPIHGWNGVTDCEVLEIIPCRRLVYSWNASGGRGLAAHPGKARGSGREILTTSLAFSASRFRRRASRLSAPAE